MQLAPCYVCVSEVFYCELLKLNMEAYLVCCLIQFYREM